MINYYKVITSNHLLTDVNNLGKYMVNDEEKTPSLINLKKQFDISEIMYLTTCNRVTYIFYTNQVIDTKYLNDFLYFLNPNATQENIEQLLGDIALYEGLEAVRHCMEVAGSIDSMVVGEREIFRQFREAYNFCFNENLTGDNLRLLEKKVVEVAKGIHTNTRIGEKPLSVAALAMTSILDEAIKPHDNKVIFVGAGETNKLMAKLLKPKKIGSYTVYNRTYNNAKNLAKYLDGKAKELVDLEKGNDDFDIMIICTSSHKHLINHSTLKGINNNPNSKKIIVDLSIPSNVSPELFELDNLLIITVEQLKELSQLNLNHRKKEIILAKKIIESSIQSFSNTYQERKLEIALSDVPKEIKRMKEKAFDEVYKKRLADLDPKSLMLIQEMMDYMERKCVSIPMKAAKKKIL